MDTKRLDMMAFAEGFIGDFLDECLGNIDEETASAKVLEQMTQVKSMWSTLSAGITDLRRENVLLRGRILLAKNSLE